MPWNWSTPSRRLSLEAVRAVLFVLVVLAVAPSPAIAQSAPRKFGRGLAAMTTGFLEVPGNMVAQSRVRGAGEGIPLGFVEGLGMIVVRELVGVYEFLSAPFPAPEGYQPIIWPEYPWGYFEGEGPARIGTPPPHHR